VPRAPVLSTRQEIPKLLNSYTCSLRLHLMHLISIISFKLGHVSIPKRHSFSPLCLFCACGSSVLQNFKIFTHLLTEVEFESCVECNYFNDRARKVRKTFPEGCKIKSGIFFRYCKTIILQLLFDNFSDVTIILVSLL